MSWHDHHHHVSSSSSSPTTATGSPGKSAAVVVASARKFLQRSFSLRSKTSPGGEKAKVQKQFSGEGSRRKQTQAVGQTNRQALKVTITERDLIISSQQPNRELDGATGTTTAAGTRCARPLSRHESLRKQRTPLESASREHSANQDDFWMANVADGNSNTLHINCLVPPPSRTSRIITLDRAEMITKGQTVVGSAVHHDEDQKAKVPRDCCDEEDDEGVITSANESEEEEEEDYVNLEEDQVGGHRLCRQVTLARSGRGLGFSIEGGAEFGRPVTIVAVAEGGAADKSRGLFVGDRIVSVNDVPINDTTAHRDAVRLLADCGEIVNIVVRHTNAVTKIRKCWKQSSSTMSSAFKPGSLVNLSQRMDRTRKKMAEMNSSNEKRDSTPSSGLHGRMSHSMTSLAHYVRIDLFGADVSHYVAYSDRLRDCSFELRTAQGGHLVIQCPNELMAKQWSSTILSTIENLADVYIDNYNQHYSPRDHIQHMGWLSEWVPTLPVASPASSSFSYRWLSRFIILKSGQCLMFKSPPTDLLLAAKKRLGLILARRNHSASSGSSLGSVGSSNSTESETSRASSSGNIDTIAKRGGRIKTDRMARLDRELDRELAARASTVFECCKADIRLAKDGDLRDGKQACFIILGESGRGYFSTEDHESLARLQQAWARANYESVIRVVSKTFTVRQIGEEPNGEDVFGSLTLDWRLGFAFFSPKVKHLLWSYKFHQLKTSSDDGKTRLSLTFVVDPTDSRVVKTHVLECSCLQTLILTIHAFLSAKVFSLHL